MHQDTLDHKFVHAIPETLEDGTVYISIDFATVVHKCCCGCGHEVVTPLSPTDWKITYDGVSVSLSPSVGNWSFPCQSHYWITRNAVRWAAQWTPEQIEAGRAADRRAKEGRRGPAETPPQSNAGSASPGILARIWRWIMNR